MKSIAVLTSGGDSPGMNAAVRAVIRSCGHYKYQAIGVRFGYKGLIEGDFTDFKDSDASGIIQRGGTILKSARSDEFRTPEGRKKAAKNLSEKGIEALVTIGGDGTFMGATLLAREHGINVVGVPGTIDNDLIGTDETIGYDTALNTAMEAIDKIRDTADAHERLFLVEVMGRDAGFIALETGIASGAELIVLPEKLTHIDEIRQSLKNILKKQRRSTLVVISEGEHIGGAIEISKKLEDDFTQYDMRVCVLGHIQRGGNPTAHDRVLASRLGFEAIKAIHDGDSGVMVGMIHDEVVRTPMEDTFGVKKEINFDLVDLYKVLR